MSGDSGAQTDLINRQDIGISSIKFDDVIAGQEADAKVRITTTDGRLLAPVDLFRRTSDGKLAKDANGNPIRKTANELAESAMNASGIADIADIEEIVRETPTRRAATSFDVKAPVPAPKTVTDELGIVLASDTTGGDRLKALESSVNTLIENRLPGSNFKVEPTSSGFIPKVRKITLSSEIPGVKDVSFNIKEVNTDITRAVDNFIRDLWSKSQEFSEAKKVKNKNKFIGNEIFENPTE
jgi:hypothetical protein